MIPHLDRAQAQVGRHVQMWYGRRSVACAHFTDHLSKPTPTETTKIKREQMQQRASISVRPIYFCVFAGAVALGVVVTDIDTLP